MPAAPASQTPSPVILTINGGSSSIKFAIFTTGDASEGIEAESIGGGGGDGGKAILGTDGLLPAPVQSATSTILGVVNDYVDDTKTSGSLTVGGFGGASGNGQNVTVTNEGGIETEGQNANAIHAESIGGGGGTGGNGADSATTAPL